MCACLPMASPGLLERHLIQFLEGGVEAARVLRQLDFLPLITAALSSLDSGVWESVVHDSTSPRLLMQHIREEILRTGLGLVGHISISAGIWERYVPESFSWVARRHFSGVGPPCDEAVVMLHALSPDPVFPPATRISGSQSGSFRHSENA